MRTCLRALMVFSLSLSMISLASADSSSMKIMAVQGNPQIIRQEQTMDAAKGIEAETGDILKTNESCHMDVAMNGLAACRVLSSSEVTVNSMETADMRLHVASGNVVLNLKKLPKESSFVVETPTAVATVRGTQFWGRVDDENPENPVTTFAVRRGSVEITDKTTGKKFELKKGSALDIPKDVDKLPRVRPALPEEMQAMEQADGIHIDG